ncbi:MAG: hypothetical protein HYR71_01650 [Chloroflexi bacterium]|nr:hypothetical protein [Chloroflexota bacterium]
MKNFVVGVLVGMVGATLLFGLFGLALNFLAPRARVASADGRPREPQSFNLPRSPFPFGQGAFGQIDDISGQTITLIGRDGNKQSIIVADETVITHRDAKVKLSNLTKGQYILVIGAHQDDGSIKARLIRLVDSSFLELGIRWHDSG